MSSKARVSTLKKGALDAKFLIESTHHVDVSAEEVNVIKSYLEKISSVAVNFDETEEDNVKVKATEVGQTTNTSNNIVNTEVEAEITVDNEEKVNISDKISLLKEQLEDVESNLNKKKKKKKKKRSKAKNVDGDAPIKGDQGELIWDRQMNLPGFLKDINDTVVTQFNLKDKMDGCYVRLFTPVKGKLDRHKEYTINPCPVHVGARIIMTIGTEVFTFKAQRGSVNASYKVHSTHGKASMIPVGVASALSICFSETLSEQLNARNGFRPITVKKDPSNRFVIVMDFVSNTEELVRNIKSHASKAAKGDSEKARKLEDMAAKMLGSTDVDDVVNDIVSSSKPVTDDDNETKRLLADLESLSS